MRSMVTVRTIDSVNDIPKADAIVRARVGGWDVVAKKDEFKAGDLCVYFEIDSFLPETDHRFQFLMGNKIKWNGNHGARLKTIKLRGQVSQGLALPLKAFPEVMQQYNGIPQDQDFAELLNVLKWEAVIPAQLAGKIRGSFPSFIRKTDQERCQNIGHYIFDQFEHGEDQYEVTLKLEGPSMTCYFNDGDAGVCSRNMNLKLDDEGNAFVKLFIESGLKHNLEMLGRNIAIQGELMGPGVQGNIEGFDKHMFFIFDIFDIDKYTYLSPDERHSLLASNQLEILGDQVDIVPIVHDRKSLLDLGITNMDELIAFADGPSINYKYREGLVFKSYNSDFTFKTISNKYLLKGG